MRARVAITGVGAITPLGCGAETLLRRWLAMESGIDDSLGRCDFEPASVLSRRETHRSDRFTQLALAAAQQALEASGWVDRLPCAAERIGCVIGTGFGGIGTIESQADVFREAGGRRLSPLAISLMMPNAAPGAIALRFRLKGPAHSVGSACAAGSDAVGIAARTIASGEVDAMVAGGADACLTPLGIAATARAGAMSRTGVSRPFDARRDGFVLGEGAGALTLENAELAAARGAPILGEVLGYGATVDAHHLTAPDPTGNGARRAIELALQDAGVGPGEVDYVNAHGTSTPLNDKSETAALKAALGRDAARVPVSSTKSVIGHLCGGAGAVEAAVTVLSLAARVAPPTVGLDVPDPELDLDFVSGAPRRLRRRGARAIGLSNSFGFGGHNAVLCIAA